MTESSSAQKSAATEPIIAVDHVHKSVEDSTGSLDILRDIDFRLAPKETVAIVGASGYTEGPGLHYEVHYDGAPVNPEDYFITQ